MTPDPIPPCRHAQRCIAPPCEGYEQLRMLYRGALMTIAGQAYTIERLERKVGELLAEKESRG